MDGKVFVWGESVVTFGNAEMVAFVKAPELVNVVRSAGVGPRVNGKIASGVVVYIQWFVIDTIAGVTVSKY